jgi:pimeloyl-ACP methyl ester carboxylesterase
MKLKKTYVYLFLFLALAFRHAYAATGVAFIHGKGSADLSQYSVAYNYWGSDMLKASTTSWKIPYVVCHYDGTQYMWTCASAVADQLNAFISANNITDLVIETHSYGGTVIRWIFSLASTDARYQNIVNATRWVNTIAGPHKGSEAADLAGTLSGSWLTGWIADLAGSDDNATENCQTDTMAYYNAYWLYGTSGRPSLPKPFYCISGWGLWNDYWTKFHSEDIGLATLSGISGLPGEDDGMVARYSAEAVGILWFRTEANHHHNRRNDYKKIGDALATDF